MLIVNEKRNENRNSRKKQMETLELKNTIVEILKSLDDLNYRMETQH